MGTSEEVPAAVETPVEEPVADSVGEAAPAATEETLSDKLEKPVEGETLTEKLEEEAPPPPERVVPDSYTLELTDGTHLDKEDLGRVQEYAKQHKLTQDEAASVLDHENRVVQSVMDRKVNEFKAEAEKWVTELRNDKELGRDNFNESMELASRFIKAYAPPDFIPQLTASGYANHPDFVRMIVKASKELGEGKFINAKGVEPKKPKSIADRMYGPGSEVK